jgi:DNA-binding NarL/FixJ family response regulator
MKLLIADDHALIRRGICEILHEAHLNLQCEESSSAQKTLKAVSHQAFDLVLLDISFPDGNGLEVLQQILSLHPHTRVLLLSMHPEEQYARRALRLGAVGYLTKDSAPEELVAAIQRIMAGGKYITQSLAERLSDIVEKRTSPLPYERLSDREFEVLTRLGSGNSIQSIALELSISPKTISTYRRRLMEKLDLKTDADLIRFVIEHKLDQ